MQARVLAAGPERPSNGPSCPFGEGLFLALALVCFLRPFFFLARFFLFFLFVLLAVGITSGAPSLNVSRLRVAREPTCAAKQNN